MRERDSLLGTNRIRLMVGLKTRGVNLNREESKAIVGGDMYCAEFGEGKIDSGTLS